MDNDLDEILQLEENQKKEELDFKKSLLDNLIEFGIIVPSKLESLEQKTKKAQHQIDEQIKAYKADISDGVTLFLKYANIEEQISLKKILKKLTTITSSLMHSNTPTSPIDNQDLDFLEDIAKRVLANGHNKDAACMFRLIIQFNFTESSAWIGWAICEQEDKHDDVVTQIYDLAMKLLPHDCLIRLYAADFYAAQNKKEKAKEILNEAANLLKQDGEQESETFKQINESLAAII